MLPYIKCKDQVYQWDLEADYTNCPIIDYSLIPNHDHTISIIYSDNNIIDIQGEEQLLLMCAIHQPILLQGGFEYFESCRVCQKEMTDIYDISMYPRWHFLNESYDNGLLLLLCQECIQETQHYKKMNDIVYHDQFLLKAVKRQEDVLFLYHRVMPMKWKKKKNCFYKNLYNHLVNTLMNKLFYCYYYIYQFPLDNDVKNIIYHMRIDLFIK
jgi:hypothetical protein